MSTSLSAFIQSAITIVKDDAMKDALPAITTFFQNIQATPGNLNLAAQLASLEVSLLAALPKLESDVVKDLSTLIQQALSTLTAPAPATPAA